MAARIDLGAVILKKCGAFLALPILGVVFGFVLLLAAGVAVLAAGFVLLLAPALMLKAVFDIVVATIRTSGGFGWVVLLCALAVLVTSWLGLWLDGSLPGNMR